MARKPKSKINKSKAIREVKSANPEAGPTEIARIILEQFGEVVAPATVSTVLSTDKKRTGTVGRPGRPKGSKNGSKAAVHGSRMTNGSSSNGHQAVFLQNLLKAKQLVSDMGGIEEARSALDALESLIGA